MIEPELEPDGARGRRISSGGVRVSEASIDPDERVFFLRRPHDMHLTTGEAFLVVIPLKRGRRTVKAKLPGSPCETAKVPPPCSTGKFASKDPNDGGHASQGVTVPDARRCWSPLSTSNTIATPDPIGSKRGLDGDVPTF